MVFLILVLPTAGGCVGGQPDPLTRHMDGSDPALTPFAGLAGRWRAPSGTGVIEEVWLPPEGRNITGALRRLDADGNATLLELLTLTAEPDGVRFRIRHMDHRMTPWPSEADGPMESVAVSSDGGVLVFDAEARAGQTARMVYDLSAPDRLTVTLLFEGGRAPLVIPFERVR